MIKNKGGKDDSVAPSCVEFLSYGQRSSDLVGVGKNVKPMQNVTPKFKQIIKL